jgi:hypothetical protein
MTGPDVTVVVPFHVERTTNGMLNTCLWSLREQDTRVQVLTVDGTGIGAAGARTAGIEAVDTKWVAFLDSDDWAYPDHVRTLLGAAIDTGADYTYSYFTIHDQWEGARPDLDPLGLFGHVFDPSAPTQTTGTILVLTDLSRDLGGFRPQDPDRLIPGTTLRYGEDFDFTVRASGAGASILHVPRRTWAWRHGHHNTSGLPGRGDATTKGSPDGGHSDRGHR